MFMSIYHPMAVVILKLYNDIKLQLMREINDIKKMQTIYSKNDEFVYKSMIKVSNKISGAILTDFKDCNIVFNIFNKDFSHKTQSTNREDERFRLIFTPIDSPINYSRGLGFFGSTFTLQEKIESLNTYKNIFTLIFTQYDNQDFVIYTQNQIDSNWVYVNEKMVKISFKTAFSISNLCFSRFAFVPEHTANKYKESISKVINSCNNFIVTESNAFSTGLLVNSAIDGLILIKQKPIDLLASFMITNNLGFFTNLTEKNFQDILSQDEIDLIALSKECFHKLSI